jgi:hypothetical protein
MKTVSKLLLAIAILMSFSQPSEAAEKSTVIEMIAARGMEIRYTKLDPATKEIPREITIDEVTYPLFKTRKEAIEHVKGMTIKKDVTIVYVVSDEEKKSEFLTVEE